MAHAATDFLNIDLALSLGFGSKTDKEHDLLVLHLVSPTPFLTKWGTHGTSGGQFNYPADVAVDASGNVYVADQSNNRIQKFGPALDFFIGEPETLSGR